MSEHIPDTSPGTSYAPGLRGDSQDWDNTVFHEFENARMIRTDRWKYTWRHPDGPDELYDMQADPGERQNLAGSSGEVVQDLRAQLSTFFDTYANPEYDVWRGGRSKAGRITDRRDGLKGD